MLASFVIAIGSHLCPILMRTFSFAARESKFRVQCNIRSKMAAPPNGTSSSRVAQIARSRGIYICILAGASRLPDFFSASFCARSIKKDSARAERQLGRHFGVWREREGSSFLSCRLYRARFGAQVRQKDNIVIVRSTCFAWAPRCQNETGSRWTLLHMH